LGDLLGLLCGTKLVRRLQEGLCRVYPVAGVEGGHCL
jgi:hypothetical protein